MTSIDWSSIYKIKIANSDPSMAKHEAVKTLLVMRLLNKHKKQKIWVRIYTEMELDNGCICDVYYENVKTKEVIAFEIQKNFSKQWQEEKAKQYKDWEVWGMKSADWIPINLNDLPDDVDEIYEKLGKYI